MLIICPAATRTNWALEIEKWFWKVLGPCEIYSVRSGEFSIFEHYWAEV